MTATALAGVRVVAVAGLRRWVSDLGRSVAFYGGGLGFELVDPLGPAPGRRACLQLGDERIELIEAARASLPSPASAPDPRFQHAAIVAADMGAAWRRLQLHGPQPISAGGPQRLPAASGGVTAWKFRDPDGHPLELIHFPRGVGDARWQKTVKRGPTLGIDHFALAVADVERSIAFHAALGFVASARQINRGVAQGRLDGLAAPVVEVVALTLPGRKTPHLELLGYRQPALSAGATRSTVATPHRDTVVLAAPPGSPSPDLRLTDPDGHALIMSG